MRHHGPTVLPALLALVASALLPAAGAAADRERAPVHQQLARRETSSGTASRPRVSGSLPERLRSRVLGAHETAIERVQELPACRDLFARLGANGELVLASSSYYAAGPARETSICRRALATTRVGGGPVHVCRRFDTLSDDEAAVVLLHEALHHSGLRERPQDPGGMEPSTISRMVRSACGL